MNPLLLDIPLQIETERLLLRAPRQSGDGTIVNDAIKESFNELKAWLPFAQTLPTVEETEVNLREAYINFFKRDSLRFLIFHKDTNDFIGVTSFEGLNWDIPKSHIGYWINTRFMGNGYMLEAVKGLCELGLNHINFKRVEISSFARSSFSYLFLDNSSIKESEVTCIFLCAIVEIPQQIL
ncbi:MAG: GNAT family N-acetyltransferase [Psychrobacillus psychrotolerans]|uniref:GNAT family N-acetyltransferase n=1 Tax=Psychrobacillus psychrotolerans TaxID=126156 RepID=UPI003BB1130A